MRYFLLALVLLLVVVNPAILAGAVTLTAAALTQPVVLAFIFGYVLRPALRRESRRAAT